MDWQQIVVIVAVLAPLYLLARLERSRQAGAALERDAVQVERDAELVGHYAGREIRAEVLYRGRRYRFECVAPLSYRGELRPGELYVEPGLLYVETTSPVRARVLQT